MRDVVPGIRDTTEAGLRVFAECGRAGQLQAWRRERRRGRSTTTSVVPPPGGSTVSRPVWGGGRCVVGDGRDIRGARRRASRPELAVAAAGKP